MLLYLEFSKDLKIETISKNHIGKIFNIIRLKIMETTHNFWKNNFMRMKPRCRWKMQN